MNPFEQSKIYFPTPIQELQFFDKYSRWRDDLGRRETWVETVDRTIDFLFNKTGYVGINYEKIKQFILEMKVMPSMRLMAMAGKAAERNNICIYNCSYMGVDSIDCFAEALLISMCGCGFGYSVERKYVDKTPILPRTTTHTGHYNIEDTTEGWVDAIRFLFNELYNGSIPNFDYSQIRPEGSILKIKGGRASGPAVLKETIDFIVSIFEQAITAKQTKLLPIQVHDIMCAIGNCSISGGTRRTALISLFDIDDEDVRKCKQGKYLNYRWNANNSAVWNKPITQTAFLRQMADMFDGESGEPGIFNLHSIQDKQRFLAPRRDMFKVMGINPCQPEFATVLTPDGIKTFKDITIGSIIWSGKRWTRVVNKVCNGIKPVYRYETQFGNFIGTKNHKVFQNGKKIEVDKATHIDVCMLPDEDEIFFTESPIDNKVYLGDFLVYDITVDADEHSYWSGGLLVSNCGEILLRNNQFCNLTSLISRADDTKEDLLEKIEVAATIGTIQSMFTYFPGLRPQWQSNCEEERLLGVDLNGQMDCTALVKDSGELRVLLRERAIEVNKKLSSTLGINQSAAISCVKPNGNSSILVDCSPGLHPRYAKYYIRNIRINVYSPIYKVLFEAGVPMCPENGQTWEDIRTAVVHFPVKSPNSQTRDKWSAIEMCEFWKKNKLYYTEHNPSVTIQYRQDEQLELINWIWNNQNIIGGMAFLPYSDAKYNNMPYEEITEEEYNKLSNEFPVIDWSRLEYWENEDYTQASQEVACVSGKCTL